jgi:DNA repair exonuclease SbcCD ATPase subunit
LTTAEHAEARAEDREEELADLQRQLEERTSALEFREEELERSRSRMEREKEELDRQKRDLMLARENLLRAGEELEEIPAAELTEERIARAPSGLAKRAADMLAAADVEEMDMEDGDGDEEGAAEGRPLARLRCKVCSTIIPIHTEARPLDIVCPSCGKEGILK